MLVTLAMLSPAHAQDRVPAGRGAPGQAATLTRSASTYQVLESRVVQALLDKDARALGQLLADDFEVWSAERSGATSRLDWQRAGFAAAQPARIRDLTVREFGGVAVVSFLLQGTPTARPPSPAVFVVDIWTQATHTLEVRYMSIPMSPAPDQQRRE